MSFPPSAVGRAELRCAEVYSQRKRFQLSVTAIITIWPEAISQGWLAMNLSHEQKLHVHAAYCLSPDLSLLGLEWTTGPQFLVTHQMKCAFLSDEIYCHLEPGDAKIMAVDGHHRAVASISMISMLCKKKKSLAILQQKRTQRVQWCVINMCFGVKAPLLYVLFGTCNHSRIR